MVAFRQLVSVNGSNADSQQRSPEEPCGQRPGSKKGIREATGVLFLGTACLGWCSRALPLSGSEILRIFQIGKMLCSMVMTEYGHTGCSGIFETSHLKQARRI